MRAVPRISFLLLAVLLAASCTTSTEAPAVPTPEPTASAELVEGATVEGITEYTLSNGLTVLLFPDESSPTTTVNITYLVGSRHESYGETGMAHLLEHMVFKGTPDHPNIPQELTAHGASPNGSTFFDRTNYFETFAATDENLEWALDLEADRMVNSLIAAEDLESEMTVVRNEFESGENSPFRVLMERLLSTMYLWHNYGNSPIGARSDIENVPVERLRAFYRKYYQPDNAILVVAGQFAEARVRELVVEKFGAIPRPDRTGEMALWPTYTADPTQDGERSVTLRRVGDVQMLGVGYHVAPGPHEDWAALDILVHALADAPTGRLYKALVEPGKAASVSPIAFQLREESPFLLLARVREEDSLEEAGSIMMEVMDGLRSEPVTEEEVARAKADLLTRIELAFNNSQRIALQLSEWAAMGDWRLMFLHRDRLEAVTADDVNAAVARYFVPSNRTLARFVPTTEPVRAELPDRPDVAALVDGYTGREAVAAGEAFDPSPDNIDRRTERFTLANGIEGAYLTKETRGDAVIASLTLRFGTVDALMGNVTIGSLVGGMLMRGTTRLSRSEIQEAFDSLKTQASIFGRANRAFFQLTTTRENLPAALDLAIEVLTDPAFDPAEFEQLKEQRLAALESQRSEPNALAARALDRHDQPWPAGHPSYTPTLDEEIAAVRAVTLEDVRDYYQRMYGATSGTFVVVGDFDPEAIRPMVDRLAALGPGAEFQRVASPYHPVQPDDIEIETPDKANAMFLARQPLEMSDRHPDYPALVMANYMLGGGFLNSRLATRIRQQEGLSYGVGSSLTADEIDENGSLQVFAIYAPENKERLQAAVLDELQKTLNDGFTAEELDAARGGWLQQGTLRRSNDRYLQTIINNNIYYGRTMAFEAELEARVRQLTVEEVNEAFRRHIDPSRMVVVKAGDFAGAAGAAEAAGEPDAGGGAADEGAEAEEAAGAAGSAAGGA